MFRGLFDRRRQLPAAETPEADGAVALLEAALLWTPTWGQAHVMASLPFLTPPPAGASMGGPQPAPRAPAVQRAFRFLLESSSLAPFLPTQDLCRLSLCSRDLRGFEQQIVALRPRAAHEPALPLLAQLQHKADVGLKGLRRGLWGDAWARSEALRVEELRAHAARRAREEGGWDAFLDALDAGRVPPQLAELDLSLQYNEFMWRPRLGTAPAMRLARSLHVLPNLRTLDLRGSQIGSKGAVALAQGLQHTPHLETLSLHGVPIGDEGMVALASVLPKLPALRVLDVGFCSIQSVGAAALADQLRHLQQLRTLNLAWMGTIGLQGLDASMNASYDDLLRAISRLYRLQDLVLAFIHLYDEGAVILADTVRSLPDLRRLYLGQTRISDAGVRAISAALPWVPGLRELHVWNNRFWEDSFKMLCSVAAQQGLVLKWNVYTNKPPRGPVYLVRPTLRIEKKTAAPSFKQRVLRLLGLEAVNGRWIIGA